MQKIDPIGKKTNILGPHFLEASAGTGKTFAIEHIFIRLLLEEKALLSIEEILVVTFTKAAERDLKIRIRKTLNQILSICKQAQKNNFLETSFFEYLQPLINDEEKIKRTIFRLEEALLFFDRSQIFTIHGFCHRMLQEFAFEAKEIFLGDEISEKVVSFSLLKKQAKEFLEFSLEKGTYHSSQIEIVIKKCKNFEGFCSKLVENLEKEFNFNLPSFLTQYDLFKEKLSFFEKKDDSFLKRIEEDFNLFYPCFRKAKVSFKKLLDQLLLIAKVIKNKSCSLEVFGEIVASQLTLFEFLDEKNQKKRKEIPPISESSFFVSAKEHLFPIIKQLCRSEEILLGISKDFSVYMEKKHEQDDFFTYNRLLTKMKKSLDEESFLKEIQKKYKAAFIDEFQDTDPEQWSIFKKIFLNNSLAFYLVGDPKQSIYSFRKADLYTYLKAAKDIGEENCFRLNTNYRSTSYLNSALNALFDDKFSKKWLYLPKEKLSLSYVAVESGKKENSSFSDKKKALHFLLAEKKLKGKTWPSVELEEKAFFSFLLEEITELRKRISYNEIAVLVKDRYQAQRIVDFFGFHSIPYQTKGHFSLLDSLAFRSLKELFDAVIFFKDKNKIKTFLSGEFIGWNAQQIEEISELNEMKVFFHLQELKDILVEKGLSCFFHSFLKTKWIDDEEIIVQKMVQKEDLTFYKDVMQLIELFLSENKTQKLSEEKIMSFFEDLLELDPDQDGKIRRRFCFDEPGIQIMTIHMSKGLEFSVVFAFGLMMRSPSLSSNLFLKQEDIEELDAEKLRQFYVALTRAKNRVYLPFAIDLSGKPPPVGSASPMELFCAHIMKEENQDLYSLIGKFDVQSFASSLKELPEVSYEILNEKGCNRSYKEKDEEKLNVFKPFCIRKSIIPLLSFSQLTKGEKKSLEPSKKEENQIIFSPEFLPIGAQTGVILHRIFEKLFSIQDPNFYKEEVYQPIIDGVINNSFLEGSKEKIYEMFRRLLNISFMDKTEKFSLKDISINHMQVEMEFLYSLSSSFVKGFIDFSFFYKGTYYLVDWKSNWLGNNEEDYSSEALQKAVTDNSYHLQGAIYTEAFRRFLEQTEKDFKKSFGGMFYVFLRGLPKEKNETTGIYHFFPDLTLIRKIEEKEICMD
jgi:exodeoxyribonuclease V beta subunit